MICLSAIGTNFVVLPSSQSADPALAGLLAFVSATQLKFSPKAGNKIKINGVPEWQLRPCNRTRTARAPYGI